MLILVLCSPSLGMYVRQVVYRRKETEEKNFFSNCTIDTGGHQRRHSDLHLRNINPGGNCS